MRKQEKHPALAGSSNNEETSGKKKFIKDMDYKIGVNDKLIGDDREFRTAVSYVKSKQPRKDNKIY